MAIMVETIDIELFDSDSKLGIIKATVHKTGKLGFSSGAAKLLDLEQRKFFQIGFNKSNNLDKSLYLFPALEDAQRVFKLIKAGEYYYLFIKSILHEKQIDYKNESVIYDIEKTTVNGRECYKLTRRQRK